MHRLTVALLSAFDAVVAAAAGLAAALAALTALFLFGFGERALWSALWPAAGAIWQAGNLVPLEIALPGGYIAATGIPEDAAVFVLSLAPLAFAAFTAIFAARSGARAAGAQAWITGVLVGGGVFTAAAAAVALTALTPVARPMLWQAIAFPGLLYAGAALVGAIVAGWKAGDGGMIDRLRDRVDALSPPWRPVVGLLARGTAMTVALLVGLGAAAATAALVAGGGEIIALSEAGHLDVLGAAMMALGTLAFLPTLVVWGMSWVAGPGFAVGVGTAVSPAGTQVGVVPGIPVFGAIPQVESGWWLLVVLLPVAAAAFAGWSVRSRYVSVLDAAPGAEPAPPRLVLAGGIAILSAASAAALAALASGGIGPGRLAQLGPAPGPVALAVGLEVLAGAAILLLSPRWQPRTGTPEDRTATDEPGSRDAATDTDAVGSPDAGTDADAAGPARPGEALLGSSMLSRVFPRRSGAPAADPATVQDATPTAPLDPIEESARVAPGPAPAGPDGRSASQDESGTSDAETAPPDADTDPAAKTASHGVVGVDPDAETAPQEIAEPRPDAADPAARPSARARDDDAGEEPPPDDGDEVPPRRAVPPPDPPVAGPRRPRPLPPVD